MAATLHALRIPRFPARTGWILVNVANEVAVHPSMPGSAIANLSALIEAKLAATPAAHAPWQAGADERTATLDLLEQLATGASTQAAVLLHSAMQAGLAFTDTELRAHGAEVLDLIEGQRAAERVWALYAGRGVTGSAEGLRRLLLAIIRDLRVVLILLARQLVRMRAADAMPESARRALAELTIDIHAPLANRLGIWQLKWELEDLAFRYLQADVYRRIAVLLDETRGEREAWIAEARVALEAALRAAGIEAEVAGRPKHIYSIWRKMQKKGLDFSALYDIRALRVLVADLPACYAALGVVHSLWSFVPGEFDDYIANPKGNQYQSLHTAVIGAGGRALEVQIRTHDMHAHAELGFAAHWRYKEGSGGDASFERKIAWMRQLLENRDADDDDDAALLAGFRTDVIEDRVYLLTPKGQVIDLPRTATVLDFAYSIHTDVGHRCRGAKVNGRIVPLNFQPASGDRVEILTGKTLEPRRDWLSTHHGFLNTARGREKVRAWFKRIDFEQNIVAGRAILERELKRLALHSVDLESLPALLHLQTIDEVNERLALGDVTPTQIARVLHEQVAPRERPAARTARTPSPARDAVVIDGVGNLMTALARCCQPLPGDRIAGFITRGRGVSVHREDCAQLQRLRRVDPDRVIDVEWGARGSQAYEVDIVVRGYDRKWLHKDVTNVIAAANVYVIAVNARVDPASGEVEMNFALRVADFGQLATLLGRILAVPNVIEARRLA